MPSLGRERRPAPRPEAHAATTVERLRPNTKSDATDLENPPATTGDYQPLDTKAAAPSPQVARSATEPLIVHRGAGIPSTYRLRKLSNRKESARQFGGNDHSERAVEASLGWLAKVQTREGYWDADAFGAGQVTVDESGVDRDHAGRDPDSGVTALTILAFLGAGYTHEEGKYADTVDRALRWLIGQQQPDGNFGLGAGHFAMMYCHGMATYAIAEAYGMQNDPTANVMLREPLVRGVRYILDNQNSDGGWRYVKGQKSDMSMFGWQLMALKSAEIAGVTVPRNAKVKMVSFSETAEPWGKRRIGRLSRRPSALRVNDRRGPLLQTDAGTETESHDGPRRRAIPAGPVAERSACQRILLVLRHAGHVSARRRRMADLESGRAGYPGLAAADERRIRRQLGPGQPLGEVWRPHLFDRIERAVSGSLLSFFAPLSTRRRGARLTEVKTEGVAACSSKSCPAVPSDALIARVTAG